MELSWLPLLLAFVQPALPAEQWRIVQKSGAVEAVAGTPRLAEADRRQISAAWVWSQRQAPRRVEPARVGALKLQEDEARLSVRVARPAPREGSAELRLLAAPREMWVEIPEALLPSWPVPADGRLAIPVDHRSWRLRVAGKGEGTWWVDVPAGQKATVLTTVTAPGLAVAVLDPKGASIQSLHGSVQEAVARGGAARLWTSLEGELGRLAVPGLPDDQEVSLTVLHPGAAPLILRGRPSSFPREVRLSAGAELKGRVVGPRGLPLAGVPVEAEAWAAPDLPQVERFKSRTDARGAWRLPGLPAGKVALSLRAPGFVPVVETLDVEAGVQDLGIRKLEPGLELAVEVVDDAGAPVAGARLSAGSGRITGTADGQGVARLAGLPSAPLELKGAAERHLAGRARVNPPFPPRTRLVLPRALTLIGRHVDTSGVPVSRGSVRVVSGTCSTESHLSEGGHFELSVPPSTRGELVLRSPATPELRVGLKPGEAGEVRDLGDLKASAGAVVTGRVVRAADGSALPGARVWTTRPGPDGPAVAWATRDLLEAQSGEDGRFRLSGLQPGVPTVLRFETPGFARAQRALPPSRSAAEEGPIDLGTIHLTAGATLRVEVDTRAPGSEGAVARADVGNRWLDPDLLTAVVRDGEAVVPHVPPGPVTVSVLAGGRRLLCEQKVEVPEEGELEVDCRHPALTVAGQVLVGSAPASGGILTWQIPNLEVPGRIDTLVSPAGLRQQQVAGLGRPQVDVAVAPDGRFETDDLVPGRWQVSWSAEQGAVTGSLTVDVPPGERFETVLPFAGLALTGAVADAEGKPVEGARVRELTTGALAFTSADGGFMLAGLKPGKGRLQAQLREQTSALREVELSLDHPADPVHLVLGERQEPTVRVQVTDAGRPAAGAFVFLEEEGKGQRLVTTAADGQVRVTLEAPLPRRVRAAVYFGGRWGFGAWVPWETALRGLAVPVEGAFSLQVQSARRGAPRIVSEGGWDVSWLLRLLGAPPTLSPDQPLQLAGLPAGRYTVSLQEASVTIPTGADGGEGTLE